MYNYTIKFHGNPPNLRNGFLESCVLVSAKQMMWSKRKEMVDEQRVNEEEKDRTKEETNE